jgi:hypothetical protein
MLMLPVDFSIGLANLTGNNGGPRGLCALFALSFKTGSKVENQPFVAILPMYHNLYIIIFVRAIIRLV